MFVGFIGSPASGKTTTAARVFAELKSSGQPCEFIAEQARYYIAKKRCELGMGPEDFPELSDEDQIEIFLLQANYEEIMCDSVGPDVVVISDSCALNSLLYMTHEAQKGIFTFPELYRSLKRYQEGLLYIATPFQLSTAYDPNRIHSPEESLRIHESIQATLLMLGDANSEALIPTTLFGTPDFRTNTVARDIYDRLLCR